MKRIFILVFALFLICSLSISAADSEYKLMDIHVYGSLDGISSYVASPLNTVPNTSTDWYYKSLSQSLDNGLLRAVALFTYQAGLDLSFQDIQSWSNVILLDCQLKGDYSFVEACQFTYWFYPDSIANFSYYVGFSSGFVSQWGIYYNNILSEMGMTFNEKPFTLVSTYYSDSFYSKSTCYVPVLHERPNITSFISDILFLPVNDYLLTNTSGGLLDIFQTFFSTIDINVLTGWLPPLLASPFIAYYAIFLTLLGFLVTIKILHG